METLKQITSSLDKLSFNDLNKLLETIQKTQQNKISLLSNSLSKRFSILMESGDLFDKWNLEDDFIQFIVDEEFKKLFNENNDKLYVRYLGVNSSKVPFYYYMELKLFSSNDEDIVFNLTFPDLQNHLDFLYFFKN